MLQIILLLLLSFFSSASTYALFNETGEADRDEVVKIRNPPAPLELK